jgi:signal transduction histidine kinase
VRVTPADLTVRGDMDKLKQVVLNLVRNAVDALSEQKRGTIVLSATAFEHGAQLSVEDDGPGVPDDVAQRAFRPFVTSKPAGTGLGLSIVQKIVAQHGGQVELVPRNGGGTVARFVLPR